MNVYQAQLKILEFQSKLSCMRLRIEGLLLMRLRIEGLLLPEGRVGLNFFTLIGLRIKIFFTNFVTYEMPHSTFKIKPRQYYNLGIVKCSCGQIFNYESEKTAHEASNTL